MTALVETGWLAARLDDPATAVVEVNEDTTAYEKGHIAGYNGSWTEYGSLVDVPVDL